MSAARSRRELRQTSRLARAATLAIGLAFAWCTGASAQPYPSKPIHIVVPFAPGGGTGQVGTEYVARSAPDGYTLLVSADATFVTSPHVYSKLPYDPINDFVPITGLGISPRRWSCTHRCLCGRLATLSISPRNDRANSITEPSASGRADTSTLSCWRA